MTVERPHVELIRSHALDTAERDAVLSLRISAEQLEFAGGVARSVEACDAGDPAEIAGLAIREAGAVVGWVEAGERRAGRVGLERTMALAL